MSCRLTSWERTERISCRDATSPRKALSAPFRVYGPDGEVYEGGTVNGSPITIDPGTYRVEVLTDPIITFDEVVVPAGQSVSVELPSP